MCLKILKIVKYSVLTIFYIRGFSPFRGKVQIYLNKETKFLIIQFRKNLHQVLTIVYYMSHFVKNSFFELFNKINKCWNEFDTRKVRLMCEKCRDREKMSKKI